MKMVSILPPGILIIITTTAVFYTGTACQALAPSMTMPASNSRSRYSRNNKNEEKLYRYFGYGSNVIPSTMKALRQIDVGQDAVTAAILPNYELVFNSAAFVTRTDSSSAASTKDASPTSVVHGVLYTLTEKEFVKIGQTEGVPFGYRWKKCYVYPYIGNCKTAGRDCIIAANNSSSSNSSSTTTAVDSSTNSNAPVLAYTLIEPSSSSSSSTSSTRSSKNNIRRRQPPNGSYLRLLQEGARLWKFDGNYQQKLASIQPKTKETKRKKLLRMFGDDNTDDDDDDDGWEGPVLELAEKLTGTKRTYRIPD